MRRWGRSRVMEGATVLVPVPRRGHSTRRLTTTIAALQGVYARTHADAAGDDGVAGGPAPGCGGAAGKGPAAGRRATMEGSAFLSDHARVLVCLAEGPGSSDRALAARAGVSEADLAWIVADLVADGYLRRSPGRGLDRYEVDPECPLRHPAERGARVGDLLAVWRGRRTRWV